MELLVPTEIEARILRELGLFPKVIGMGPVEAALGAYQALEGASGLVVLAGIGGAYPGSGLEVGDLALATSEYFGDFGACYERFTKDLADHLPVRKECSLRGPLLEKAVFLLEEGEFAPSCGPFVTVCCATRDPERGEILSLRHQGALIENMEGFAVARATERLGLPLLELRAVSNLIAEPERPWAIDKALWRLGKALIFLQKAL